MPVNTIASPAASAAAITSSSRIEPPGWITAVAPASTAASRPSAKGKTASEATAAPLERGVGVVVIVVAELLALHLPRLADTAHGGPGGAVEGSRLVGVLAVAQRLAQPERQRQGLGEALALVGEGETAGDNGVIRGGGC